MILVSLFDNKGPSAASEQKISTALLSVRVFIWIQFLQASRLVMNVREELAGLRKVS